MRMLMFGKVIEGLEKAGVRSAFKKGALRCPDCGAKAGKLPEKWDGVMECGSCGAKTSLSEWAPAEGGGMKVGDADRPPVGTKIRKDSAGAESAVWNVPASGKFGFFLFFAIFWLLITAVVSGGFLLAFLGGEEIEGDFPIWVAIPFFGVFWAVGLGTLYAAFRQKFMRYRLSVGSGKVTLRKEMFGRASEKALDASSVTSVSQQVFYSQNYTPVYGIEIRGADGKLRFGTGLREEEKAWLVADVKKTMGGKEADERAISSGIGSVLEPIKLGRAGKSVFSVEIPKPGVGALIGSLVFAVFGIGFVCIGIFLIGDDGASTKQGDGGIVGSLMENGFRTFWILFSSVFVLIGVGMAFSTLRAMGRDQRIEGNEAEIAIRTYRNGLVMKNRSFPRSQVHDIRTSNSGHNNGKPMKRIDLIVGDKVEKIAGWMDGDAADRLVDEVREALGK